jgi:hypothetical protein
VRPLPSLQRRRSALASVVGHGVVFTLLAGIGIKSAPPVTESPLIVAELVTALEPSALTTAVVDERSASPPQVEPERQIAEPAPEPPAPPEPEIAAPVPTPEPPVLPEPEPPRDPEPAAEPPPERLVETLEPPPVLPPTPIDEPAPAQPVETAPAMGPSRALESHEERAVRRRLSSWTGELSADAADTVMTWRDDGQDYTAVLKRVPAPDAMSMEQLAVELTTERDGEQLVTELRMNRIAFSNFAQFIDRWDPEVQIHDDTIDGRFHSNSEILISRGGRAKPVFKGKVTLAARDVRSDGVGYFNKRSMFPAGLETRVRRIALPPRAATFEASVVPAGRLHRVTRDSLITFHPDGTFEARATAGEGAAEMHALGEEPFYVVADDTVALHVHGTVNGKVLVYSPGRIIITDDLRYADDPRAPNASDYLGLVAERSVEIGGPETTGPGDLEVHASIYARSRFLVQDFRSRRSGTLVIYGSVAAGSVSATEPRFATRIEFDDRLTTMRAPGFPLSDRYELDTASDEWRVVGAVN